MVCWGVVAISSEGEGYSESRTSDPGTEKKTKRGSKDLQNLGGGKEENNREEKGQRKGKDVEIQE